MKVFNTIFNSSLDASKNNRFCIHCHIRLEPSQRDKYIYTCPQCGVTANIYNTEPAEKLVTTFPTSDPNRSPSSQKFVHQPDKDRISRSTYFIKKNMSKRSETEDNDPYLKILKMNNKIKLTNVEYYDPTED